MQKIGISEIEIKFRNWKLNSEFGKSEFRKLGIKFGILNFEELFKDGILKINK